MSNEIDLTKNRKLPFNTILNTFKSFLNKSSKQPQKDQLSGNTGALHNTKEQNIIQRTNHHKPAYYAISNDRYMSYPYLNSVVTFNPYESLGITRYLLPIIKCYPTIDDASNNKERESIVRAAFEDQGLKEHVDFEFAPLEKLQSMVNDHNTIGTQLDKSLLNLANAYQKHYNLQFDHNSLLQIQEAAKQMTKSDIASFLESVCEAYEVGYDIPMSDSLKADYVTGLQKADYIKNYYMKEFPAIKHISNETALKINYLKHDNDCGLLSINNIKDLYKETGKKLEQGFASPADQQRFNDLKEVVDDLVKAATQRMADNNSDLKQGIDEWKREIGEVRNKLNNEVAAPIKGRKDEQAR